jgi:hypothetical protein
VVGIAHHARRDKGITERDIHHCQQLIDSNVMAAVAIASAVTRHRRRRHAQRVTDAHAVYAVGIAHTREAIEVAAATHAPGRETWRHTHTGDTTLEIVDAWKSLIGTPNANLLRGSAGRAASAVDAHVAALTCRRSSHTGPVRWQTTACRLWGARAARTETAEAVVVAADAHPLRDDAHTTRAINVRRAGLAV